MILKTTRYDNVRFTIILTTGNISLTTEWRLKRRVLPHADPVRLDTSMSAVEQGCSQQELNLTFTRALELAPI